MSVIMNCGKLVGTRINNISKIGGYVSRGAKSIADYDIKWVRPERVLEIDPRQSGDLGIDIPIKPNDFIPRINGSKELETASDLVKKVFSLQHSSHKETRRFKKEKIIDLVKRHNYDTGSWEVKIAAMTSTIHDLQKHMQGHERDKTAKVTLKEMIDKRRKYLRLLRKADYQRFEWVLESLNLVYKPIPEKLGMVSRKESLRRVTQQYCDKIIENKWEECKAEFNIRKKEFYNEKVRALEFILKEERECGLTPTVTEEDINEVRAKAAEL